MNVSSTVAIIGLGYVGLPLAVHFAERGHTVLGLDKDTRKNRINYTGRKLYSRCFF